MRDVVVSHAVNKRLEPLKQPTHYHSVEFSVQGLSMPYQFKIYHLMSTAMCLVIKEDSNVLQYLKTGDTLHMRYYSGDSCYPSEYLETAIRHITKNDNGRFRGHYLVGLEILNC
jgi:hypothetical protein